jgi:hypothetical protein
VTWRTYIQVTCPRCSGREDVAPEIDHVYLGDQDGVPSIAIAWRINITPHECPQEEGLERRQGSMTIDEQRLASEEVRRRDFASEKLKRKKSRE